MAITTTARLLLKAPPAAVQSLDAPRLAIAGQIFSLEPLFQQGPHSVFGMADAAAPQWFIADSHTPADQANLWELAHQAVAGGLGLGLTPGAGYAEPDLVQSFPYSSGRLTTGTALTAADPCTPLDPANIAPVGPSFAWHTDDNFNQLRAARATVDFTGDRVKIGILDTGYDPLHVLLPVNLKREWGRDFAEEGRPDASDPDIAGFLQNPGHGTATICILAGNKRSKIKPADFASDDYFGGAPLADIVPVRIANSVILFRNSSFARGLEYLLAPNGDPKNRVDVVSISMGGAASGAWVDIVNRAYESGVCIVAAAGNGKPGGFPTRGIVYPARFHRVIAACGIMANRQPYAHLPDRAMEGNYGPASKMATALAAFTPNVPWPKIGCDHTIVDRDGQGTSSATPQVAASAALWLQKYLKHDFGEGWRRVEAVRKALFDSADKNLADVATYFGNGAVRALQALSIEPAANLVKQPEDNASFLFLKALTGLGAAADPRQPMFDLEIVQLAQSSAQLESIVPDPDAAVPENKLRNFVEAVIEDPRASRDLRLFLTDKYAERFSASVPVHAPPAAAAVQVARAAPIPEPVYRNLRGFAFDPSLSLELDTEMINSALFEVPWEHLDPGPKGEYLEVVDTAADGTPLYEPVDLNHPHILAQDGLAPSQDNPQFHQQMVYAVARTTIQYFEIALGRPVLWSAPGQDDNDDSVFLPRLKVLPHAMQQANAFYSPKSSALLFGYFDASRDEPGDHYPGGRVYTCLSHDIVAHETTHAILDGLHRRFQEPSNADMLAFHEGFADLIALFQHFAMPEALAQGIAKSRGDLKTSLLLSNLAREFGYATGRRAALRSGIGEADPQAYQTKFEVHARGSILVAAVFDAFLAIYEKRAAAVLRIATSGTGVLPPGSISKELTAALAHAASKSSTQMLSICIRALDYCPPVDLTFGDYLRALITADRDFVADDDMGYRVAFVEAFRRRGIYPEGLQSLSVESLLWPRLANTPVITMLTPLIDQFREFTSSCRYMPKREELFTSSRAKRRQLHEVYIPGLFHKLSQTDRQDLAEATGMVLDQPFEVSSLRVAHRSGPDGNPKPQLVLEITQCRTEYLDQDAAGHPIRPFQFRGGVTFIIDLDGCEVRYAIKKDFRDPARLQRQRDFLLNGGKAPGAAYFQSQQFRVAREPFALLHQDG